MAARAQRALRLLTRRDCSSAATEGSEASFSAGHETEHRKGSGAKRRTPYTSAGAYPPAALLARSGQESDGATDMIAAPRQSPGHLAENVMHFARVLAQRRHGGGHRPRAAHAAGAQAGWLRQQARLPRGAHHLHARSHRAQRLVRPGVRAVLARPRPRRPHARDAVAQGARAAGPAAGAAREPAPGRCAVSQSAARRTAAHRRRRGAVRCRLHGERPRGAAQGRLRHHECRRVARRAARAGAAALGVRAAADAARRALVSRRPHRLARHACRRWRATVANSASCAGAGRARCRRRWWCWPTSRAR